MALIKCPECGKEISDKAKACPECGYELKQNVEATKQESFFKKNKIAVLVIGIVIIIAIVAGVCIKSIPLKSPFEKISVKMTREQGKKALGKPDSSKKPTADVQYYIDTYNNVKFLGMKGNLEAWYYKNEKKALSHAIWKYDLDLDKSFNDYQKQIDKIINFYTELYGTPTSEYSDYEWKDYNGTEISQDLKQYDSETIPDCIYLWYNL